MFIDSILPIPTKQIQSMIPKGLMANFNLHRCKEQEIQILFAKLFYGHPFLSRVPQQHFTELAGCSSPQCPGHFLRVSYVTGLPLPRARRKHARQYCSALLGRHSELCTVISLRFEEHCNWPGDFNPLNILNTKFGNQIIQAGAKRAQSLSDQFVS